MGQYFSSRKEEVPIQRVAVPPRQEIIINITSSYPTNSMEIMKCAIKNNSKSKKASGSATMYGESKKTVVKKNKTSNIVDPLSTLLKPIHEYPKIGINGKLLVARCGNFSDETSSLSFASSLRSMILSTPKGSSLFRGFKNNTVLTCRFLKILVTNDNRFYLMPLQYRSTFKPEEWIEDTFTRDRIIGEIGSVGPNLSVFSNILSMIKRQKQLINPNGSFIFCVEFKLNTLLGIVFNDRFHQDDDLFGDRMRADYLSITNTSQSQPYGYSTEIRTINDDKSYTMLTRPGDTTIIANRLLQHRVPKINPINATRYVTPDENGSSFVYHQSNLASINQETLQQQETINQINQSLSDNEPRHIIRVLITELIPEIDAPVDLTRLVEITDLVPLHIYVSPITNYEGTSDRNPDNSEDIKVMINLLKDHSIGGKSKKKRRKRKRQTKKKRVVRKNYSSRQRGGAGDLSDLKYLNEYFAIYADPETACLIENNIEVII